MIVVRPIEDRLTLILRERYEAAGVPYPAFSWSQYESVQRQVALIHSLNPVVDEFEEFARLEGFELVQGRIYACGGGACSMGETLYVGWKMDPKLRALLNHHERAHGWMRKLRWEDANEADAWRLTTALVLPPWVRSQGPLFASTRFPFWFLSAAGMIKAA